MRTANDDPQHNTPATTDEPLPNLVTIVGRGVPGTYELAVDGDVRPESESPESGGFVTSGGCVEGSIDAGIARFRFSGEVANLRLVDWNGVEATSSSCAPTAHVTYGASDD